MYCTTYQGYKDEKIGSLFSSGPQSKEEISSWKQHYPCQCCKEADYKAEWTVCLWSLRRFARVGDTWPQQRLPSDRCLLCLTYTECTLKKTKKKGETHQDDVVNWCLDVLKHTVKREKNVKEASLAHITGFKNNASIFKKQKWNRPVNR